MVKQSNLKKEILFQYQALGVGKLAGDENELSQAPEEEEDFDVLNEETFGDLGDGTKKILCIYQFILNHSFQC